MGSSSSSNDDDDMDMIKQVDPHDDDKDDLETIRLEGQAADMHDDEKQSIPPQQEKEIQELLLLQLYRQQYQLARSLRRQSDTRGRCHSLTQLLDRWQSMQHDCQWATCTARQLLTDQKMNDWTATGDQVCSYATWLIVAVMTLVMIYASLLSFVSSSPSSSSWTNNPMLGPDPTVLLQSGGCLTDTYSMIQEYEYYRLGTAAFLHAGWIHWAVSVAGWWVIGTRFEQAYGSYELLFVFGITAVGGNMLSATLMPTIVGGSGATGGLFGVLGACLATVWNNWNHLGEDTSRVSSLVVVLCELLLWVGLGFHPFVDNICNMGGLLIGVALGTAFLPWESSTQRSRLGGKRRETQLWRILNIVMVAAIFMGISYILFVYTQKVGKDDELTQLCPWCRHLSCIESPLWDCTGCVFATGTVHYTDGMATALQINCPGRHDGWVEFQYPPDNIESHLAGYCRDFCDE